jgi:hypothetical protein
MRLVSRFGLTAITVLTVAAAAVPAASAGSLLGLNNDCGATSQPFAQFGDSRLYAFGANGGVESGGTGWGLSGAAIVKGNESYYVHSSADRYSVALPAGATATTPQLCMGTTSTVLRFFDRSGNGGKVRVQIVMRNALGAVLGVVDWTTISASTAWQPSPSLLNLDSLLGLLGVSSIQLKFTALSGTSQIDDVYVDPWWSRS